METCGIENTGACGGSFRTGVVRRSCASRRFMVAVYVGVAGHLAAP